VLLHYERQNGGHEAAGAASKPSDEKKEIKTGPVGLVKASKGPKEILMQSDIAKIESASSIAQARVLFDSGSGVTFISKKMAQQLDLKWKKVEGEFTLAGGNTLRITTGEVKFYLSSAIPQWRGEVFEIVAYVLDKPSSDLHKVTVDLTMLSHLTGLQLADFYPRHEEAEIDVMLGLEDTLKILMEQRIDGPRGTPVAQKSHIGWILADAYRATSENMGSEIYPENRAAFEVSNETDMAVKPW
jgi:hypothetical protein